MKDNSVGSFFTEVIANICPPRIKLYMVSNKPQRQKKAEVDESCNPDGVVSACMLVGICICIYIAWHGIA